jgi:hypothetical protein
MSRLRHLLRGDRSRDFRSLDLPCLVEHGQQDDPCPGRQDATPA